MRDIRIGAAQFEHRNADKSYNLSVMKQLSAVAVDRGAEIVSFHEACIPAYTFLRGCSKTQLLEIAEIIPDGPSTRKLIEMAREFKISILAGLLEKDDQIRNGNAMVIDPYGEIVAESNSFSDDVVVGLCLQVEFNFGFWI